MYSHINRNIKVLETSEQQAEYHQALRIMITIRVTHVYIHPGSKGTIALCTSDLVLLSTLVECSNELSAHT